MQKYCPGCKQNKPVENFPPNKANRDGLASKCIECKRLYDREYSERNKNRLKEYRRKWYLLHREDILKKQRAYSKENKREIYERRKDYFAKCNRDHRKKINAYNREWRKENKERIKQRRYEEGVRYRAKHKIQIRKKKQAYENERRQHDNLFKLKGQVRVMLRDSFKRKGLKKSYHTEDILGCSLDFFHGYLLKTWAENYGTKWNGEPCHIDHITPLSSAKTEDDIIKLCHYTNLQLLTPKDNLKKGGDNGSTKTY